MKAHCPACGDESEIQMPFGISPGIIYWTCSECGQAWELSIDFDAVAEEDEA